MPRKKRSLGFGFSEEIGKVTFQNSHFKKVSTEEWKDTLIPNFDSSVRYNLEQSFWRTTALVVFILIIFFALFVRLFHLQITSGKENRELADGNRILIRIIHAPRGVIFDRNGKILASNSPGFRLVDESTNDLTVGVSSLERTSSDSGKPPTLKSGVYRDKKIKKAIYLTREQAFEMEVKDDPRVQNLEVDSIRKYTKREELAHVLGYVGEISGDQLKDTRFSKYKTGDKIGQSGTEAYYEDYLRGTDGGEIIEIDAKGKKLRTLRTVEPIPGKNIYLTIDSDLQHVAFDQLKASVQKASSCCGAEVSMDPSNGQILSMISYPSFDNNIFTDTQKNDQVSLMFNDPNSPILNRSIGGVYPPGSTFKIITSIAGLASGKITDKTIVEDTGQIFLGAFKFTNWYFTEYGKVEGEVNLVKALQRSNDIFYYRVGQMVGENVLGAWARKLKLGGVLGIDIQGEVAGLVAGNDWKMKVYNTAWYPGDTLHMAIGQGFLLTTPIQILGITSFIAADGNLYRPHLLLKVTNQDGSIVYQPKPYLLVSKIVSPENIALIQKGLKLVPQNGGTAWPFFSFPIPTAGKTGTAEFGDPKDKTHAWYTSYAPAENPTIATTVVVEAGGEGSNVSAPVTKEMYRWYFSSDKNNLIKDTNFVATDSAKILGE